MTATYPHAYCGHPDHTPGGCPAPPTCVLAGADGENPDDCSTHDHEPASAHAALRQAITAFRKTVAARRTLLGAVAAGVAMATAAEALLAEVESASRTLRITYGDEAWRYLYRQLPELVERQLTVSLNGREVELLYFDPHTYTYLGTDFWDPTAVITVIPIDALGEPGDPEPFPLFADGTPTVVSVHLP